MRSRWNTLPLKKKVLFFIILLLIVSIIIFSLQDKTAVITIKKEEVIKTVTLASVGSLAESSKSFPILGTVSSVSEAVIRSESSGKLTRVYKSLSDKVVAGELIATFENSAERAGLLQAEGAYDAAIASKEIAAITGNNTNSGFVDAKSNALNTFKSTSNTLEDAVRVKTDTSFTDTKNANAQLNLSVPDSNLVYTLQEQRKVIEKVLTSRDLKNETLTLESNFAFELNDLEEEAILIKNYLDNLADAYAKALQTQTFSQSVIDAGKILVSAARSQVTSSITSIQASKTALNNSLAQKNIAEKNSGQNTSSGIADATIKQSLGALNAAQSRYQKTLIRSPLTGTLNSLSIKTGDFVTSFTQVGVVSNNGSLEIKAYVNAEDANSVSAGQTGTAISSKSTEKVVVTKVAEALDPITKKIEVKLALIKSSDTFINGETVTISLDSKEVSKNAVLSLLLIPLSAIKITPNGALVFTVEDGIAKEMKVKEGALYGENIEIKEGLTSKSVIIIDARGIKNGSKVSVAISSK